MSKQWINGKPCGSISQVTNAYIIRFQGDPTKTFSLSKYGNLETAKDAAMLYRRETSDEKGLTKNKYRFVEDHMEFQLHGGKICKIDICDFPKLIYTWNAKKGFKRYYVSSQIQGKHITIHRLIHPEWEEVDHINRDGLDNRRCNLRDGKLDNINAKNQGKRKDNLSGKTGVSFNNNKQSWVIQWPENGKRRCKTFSINRHGDEQAKQMAIQFRKELDKNFGINNGYDSDCEDKDEKYPKKQLGKFIPPLLSTNSSGYEGVSFNKKGQLWVACWYDGKRRTKTFSLKNHGEAAKELAIQKRKEMS